jgi:hypothetical protein
MPGLAPGILFAAEITAQWGVVGVELSASLRGAKRRSNPDRACLAFRLDCFASLAMTVRR